MFVGRIGGICVWSTISTNHAYTTISRMRTSSYLPCYSDRSHRCSNLTYKVTPRSLEAKAKALEVSKRLFCWCFDTLTATGPVSAWEKVVSAMQLGLIRCLTPPRCNSAFDVPPNGITLQKQNKLCANKSHVQLQLKYFPGTRDMDGAQASQRVLTLVQILTRPPWTIYHAGATDTTPSNLGDNPRSGFIDLQICSRHLAAYHSLQPFSRNTFRVLQHRTRTQSSDGCDDSCPGLYALSSVQAFSDVHPASRVNCLHAETGYSIAHVCFFCHAPRIGP